jgi:Protein of unknown function (DUF3592)
MAKTEWSQADGRVVSVDSMSTRGRRQLTVTFTYFVGNQSYKGKFYTFDSMQEGDSLLVPYDVSNPSHNRLEARQARINRVALVIAIPVVGVVLLLLWFSLRR